jgi:hypothetical protein
MKLSGWGTIALQQNRRPRRWLKTRRQRRNRKIFVNRGNAELAELKPANASLRSVGAGFDVADLSDFIG